LIGIMKFKKSLSRERTSLVSAERGIERSSLSRYAMIFGQDMNAIRQQ